MEDKNIRKHFTTYCKALVAASASVQKRSNLLFPNFICED